MLDNQKSVLTSFGILPNDKELDLPYIYWIPKVHTNPYKHRFFACSSKCSTKPISIFLIKIAYIRSSEVLQDSLLKKWDQSDVDPQEFKRIIRSS